MFYYCNSRLPKEKEEAILMPLQSYKSTSSPQASMFLTRPAISQSLKPQIALQVMQQGDGAGIHYLAPSNGSPIPIKAKFSTNNNNPMFQFGRSPNPFFNTLVYPQLQELNSHPSSFSSNSTSDDADERQMSLINERKQRRMISNRESARRARMRKQKHLDELWSQIMWLHNENDQLIEKMNHVLECHDQALQENAQLKQQTFELRHMISVSSTPGEVSWNTASLEAESSDQSNSSMGVLH